MKHSYLVIADPDTVLGFQCAGLPGVVVQSEAEAVAALRQARTREVGVVVVTEQVADWAKAEMEALRFTETLPMVVEIPGPDGPRSGRRGLADMIREAIGVKV